MHDLGGVGEAQKRISSKFANVELKFEKGKPATITFSRDVVDDEAEEEVIDVSKTWTKQDIELILKQKVKEDGIEKTEL